MRVKTIVNDKMVDGNLDLTHREWLILRLLVERGAVIAVVPVDGHNTRRRSLSATAFAEAFAELGFDLSSPANVNTLKNLRRVKILDRGLGGKCISSANTDIGLMAIAAAGEMYLPVSRTGERLDVLASLAGIVRSEELRQVEFDDDLCIAGGLSMVEARIALAQVFGNKTDTADSLLAKLRAMTPDELIEKMCSLGLGYVSEGRFFMLDRYSRRQARRGRDGASANNEPVENPVSDPL